MYANNGLSQFSRYLRALPRLIDYSRSKNGGRGAEKRNQRPTRRQGEKKLISEVIDTDKHTHTHGTSFRIALRVFEREKSEDNDKRINYPTNKARDERKCTNNYIIEFHCNPSPTPKPRSIVYHSPLVWWFGSSAVSSRIISYFRSSFRCSHKRKGRRRINPEQFFFLCKQQQPPRRGKSVSERASGSRKSFLFFLLRWLVM